MRKIAIVGAGQAGLVLGIGLVKAGYAVTLFSDQTKEEILHGNPKGFPVLFSEALQIERNLGLNFWDDEFSSMNQVHNTIYDPDGNIALVLSHSLEKPWKAVDQRLKFYTWMQEFVKRGGELIIETITVPYLEVYAQDYDLVIVAGGRSMNSNLFEPDAEKSTHNQPARRLAGGIFTGLNEEGMDSTFKVSTLPGIGEIFQMPFYDKGKNHSHTIVFEACPDGSMATFVSVKNGQEFVEQTKKLIQQFIPAKYEAVKDIQLTDENAWLCGAIKPSVKKPVGYLPSGGIVMGIGDTVVLHDPIAGQGANNANKMAYFVMQRILEHGNRRFDREWMQAVFNEYWHNAQYSNALSESALHPQPHQQEIMGAATRNPAIVKDYLDGFNHPESLSPWFFESEAAKEYLRRLEKG